MITFMNSRTDVQFTDGIVISGDKFCGYFDQNGKEYDFVDAEIVNLPDGRMHVILFFLEK